MYFTHSRVGRGRLMLSFTPHYPANSEGIAYWVSVLNAAHCLDTTANWLGFFYRWEMDLRRPPTRKASALRMSGTTSLSNKKGGDLDAHRAYYYDASVEGPPIAGHRSLQGSPGFLLGQPRPRWLGEQHHDCTAVAPLRESKLRIPSSSTPWSTAPEPDRICAGLTHSLRGLLQCSTNKHHIIKKKRNSTKNSKNINYHIILRNTLQNTIKIKFMLYYNNMMNSRM